MKRNKPLQRKTPMKRTGFKPKIRVFAEPGMESIDTAIHKKSWPKKKSPTTTQKRKPMAQRSSKRSKEERDYLSSAPSFLAAHPVCPVTGEKTDQIHHSAKREGGWLNLIRYWIAVSTKGHAWIEENKREAEKYGLMVRINEPFKTHCDKLRELPEPFPTNTPIFYVNHPELPLVNEMNQPIYL